MLIMGATVYGPPATLAKGMRALNGYAGQSLKFADVQMAEASGLSRKNRLSPSQMLIILDAFMPHYKLLRRHGNDYYKTGTLSDVKTRAGYIQGDDQKLYPYVIMLNHTYAGYDNKLKKLKKMVKKLAVKQLAP